MHDEDLMYDGGEMQQTLQQNLCPSSTEIAFQWPQMDQPTLVHKTNHRRSSVARCPRGPCCSRLAASQRPRHTHQRTHQAAASPLPQPRESPSMGQYRLERHSTKRTRSPPAVRPVLHDQRCKTANCRPTMATRRECTCSAARRSAHAACPG